MAKEELIVVPSGEVRTGKLPLGLGTVAARGIVLVF